MEPDRSRWDGRRRSRTPSGSRVTTRAKRDESGERWVMDQKPAEPKIMTNIKGGISAREPPCVLNPLRGREDGRGIAIGLAQFPGLGNHYRR
jgi:hypothetical protein